MTPEERASYSYYQKKLYSDRDELQAAEARGEARGIQIGEAKLHEEKKEIARKMLARNKPLEEIIEFTGLTEAQIINLD